MDEEKSYQMMEGVTLNEKFSQDPKKYFEEKLMTAIFRKVWHKVSAKLDIVANLHSGMSFVYILLPRLSFLQITFVYNFILFTIPFCLQFHFVYNFILLTFHFHSHLIFVHIYLYIHSTFVYISFLFTFHFCLHFTFISFHFCLLSPLFTFV